MWSLGIVIHPSSFLAYSQSQPLGNEKYMLRRVYVEYLL